MSLQRAPHRGGAARLPSILTHTDSTAARFSAALRFLRACAARHHRDASAVARSALVEAERALFAADAERFGKRRAKSANKLHCTAGHSMARDGRASREGRLCDRCHRIGVGFVCHRGCDYNVCQRCALACVASFLGGGKRVTAMSNDELEEEACTLLDQLPAFGARAAGTKRASKRSSTRAR